MTRSPLRHLLPLLLLAAAPVAARAADNPHVEPATCLSCHTKVPTAEEGQAGDYFLTKDTIDDTCQVCHPYGCCTVGALKGGNHPSNINSWDRNLFTRPKTLPLFNGYITCDTCHFYRQAQEDPANAFQLVRIVKVEGDHADWSVLCVDCHQDD